MNLNRLRDFFFAWLLGGLARLKPERIQDRSLPGETSMTVERVCNRAAEAGYELTYVPVAATRRYHFADFDAAVDFVAGDLRHVAGQQGLTPKIEIDRGVVTVTVGIPIPPLLSEADFDFAEALQAIRPPEEGQVPYAEPETDSENDPAAGA